MDFPKGLTELSRDTRRIKSIAFEEDGSWQVGSSCDRIEAYDETGEMAHVPWLAVINNGAIIARVPARMVVVSYFTE